MSQPSSTEPRRYLIAIGSPYCPAASGYRDLPRVESDIKAITELFETQGYEPGLSLVSEVSERIITALSSWFSNTNFSPSDCVVVYYAGHAHLEDRDGYLPGHYLLTIDSKLEELESKAILTERLVRAFFQGRIDQRPRNILLILDTCYANAGARDSNRVMSQMRGDTPEGSGFWVISAADAGTEAEDGTFVQALCAVMNSDCEEFQRLEAFIPIDMLVTLINQQLPAQRVIGNATGIQREAVFIRNPRFLGLGSSGSQSLQGQEQQSAQLAQLIDCLWSLDYTSQSRTFEDITKPRSRRAAAFVVQAKDARIQQWLVKRLVNQLPNVKNAKVLPFMIPSHPMWKQRDFNELWIDLAKQLECKPDKAAVIDTLAATYQTKPVIVAMYGWSDLARSQELQRQVLTDFWEPLVNKIKDLSNQPLRSRLILFLAEGTSQDPAVSDDLNVPIRLASLTEIGMDDVAAWLESDRVSEILGEDRIKLLIEKDISDWTSDPMETLQQICYVFELKNGISDIESEWRLAG